MLFLFRYLASPAHAECVMDAVVVSFLLDIDKDSMAYGKQGVEWARKPTICFEYSQVLHLRAYNNQRYVWYSTEFTSLVEPYRFE